jgi:hypothetical protein
MADGVPITAGTGTTVATDDCGASGHAQLLKLAISANGDATLVPADAANGIDVDVTRLPGTVASDLSSLAGKDFATQTTLAAVLAKLIVSPATEATLASVLSAVDGLEALQAHGTYGYASGTATATVDVPAGARVKRVSVIAGASSATITIAGGDMITVPAGASFDEQIPGDATLGGDVVIGGTITSYYVAWTV